MSLKTGPPSSGKGKDRVPSVLKKILELDTQLTKKFVAKVDTFYPKIQTPLYKSYLKGLEISCHGIPWFACVLISIYLFRAQESRIVEMNLLFGLLYDVMVVAFIKAVTRRNRPSGNKCDDMFMTRGVDKFSFPSGHASRAVFVALFFTQWAYPEMSFLVRFPLYIWALAVCISRVLLRRHHLLDVLAGIGIGFLELILSGILWLGPEASKMLGDWIASSEDEYNG